MILHTSTGTQGHRNGLGTRSSQGCRTAGRTLRLIQAKLTVASTVTLILPMQGECFVYEFRYSIHA